MQNEWVKLRNPKCQQPLGFCFELSAGWYTYMQRKGVRWPIWSWSHARTCLGASAPSSFSGSTARVQTFSKETALPLLLCCLFLFNSNYGRNALPSFAIGEGVFVGSCTFIVTCTHLPSPNAVFGSSFCLRQLYPAITAAEPTSVVFLSALCERV